MLEVDFIQNFPVRNQVVIAGLMTFTEFVCETTFGVPGEQASIIVGDFLTRGIAKLGSLLVVPRDLIGIVREGDGSVGFVHPLWDGTEVENDGVTFCSLQKID